MAGNLVPRGDNISTIGTLIKRYIKGFFYGLDVKSGVNAPIKTLQRSTAYVIGDVVTTDALHAKYYLKCTTAGTTGSSEPSFTGATSNSTVTDGTAVWTVQTITSTEEVSSSVENTYAPKESPAFTGNPTAPTQTSTDNSTKIATTAFVQGNLADYAPLASPALTGNPTAPTQVASDSSTKVATTAFVHGHTDDKAPLASPAFTGTPTAPTPAATDNSAKLATTAWASNAPAIMHNIGANPITDVSNDTKTFWKAQGNCIAFFGNTKPINGQPSDWGMLVSRVVNNEIIQIWIPQDFTRDIWMRGANSGSAEAMPTFQRINGPVNLSSKVVVEVTSGNATVTGKQCIRSGNVVHLTIIFTTTARIPTGGNVTATVSGIPLPAQPSGVTAVGYATTLIYISNFLPNGSYNLRMMNGDFSSGYQLGTTLTYICNNTD